MFTVEKLRACNQRTLLGSGLGHSGQGVCFYMSKYVDETIWGKGNFLDLVARSRTAVPLTIANWGKTSNVQDKGQRSQFLKNAEYEEYALANESLHQISMTISDTNYNGDKDLDQTNHQIVAAFGGLGRVLFFDPNFGFYLVKAANTSPAIIVETQLVLFYEGNQQKAGNFWFLEGRKIPQG